MDSVVISPLPSPRDDPREVKQEFLKDVFLRGNNFLLYINGGFGQDDHVMN